MSGWLWASLCACGASPLPAPPSAPPGALGRPALERPSRLSGLCDASAAVEVPGAAPGPWLVVADDERDRLQVFAADLTPAGAVDLEALSPALAADGEADLEGMTTAPDGTVWVIGSHDAGKGTEPRRERFVLLSLRMTAEADGVRAELVGPVDTSGAVRGPVESGTEGRTSKDEHGLSIEGLAWREGALEVGFRNPVRDGRAPVVRLGTGGPAVRWVDFGGRGVRSMEGDLVIAASDQGFALFRTSADGPGTPLSLDFGDFTAEALVHRTGSAEGWWVISDDGRRPEGSRQCKDLPASDRWTRIARVPDAVLQR